MDTGYETKQTEIKSNLDYRENQLVHIGVVISTMAIVATVSLVLIMLYDSDRLAQNTISSVGKTEPA